MVTANYNFEAEKPEGLSQMFRENSEKKHNDGRYIYGRNDKGINTV